MGKDIVIFGTSQNAQLANWYIENGEWAHLGPKVVAFTEHSKYRTKDAFEGKPVVDFEGLEEAYPPDRFRLFAPMSGKDLNRIRERVYNEGKEKG